MWYITPQNENQYNGGMAWGQTRDRQKMGNRKWFHSWDVTGGCWVSRLNNPLHQCEDGYICFGQLTKKGNENEHPRTHTKLKEPLPYGDGKTHLCRESI